MRFWIVAGLLCLISGCSQQQNTAAKATPNQGKKTATAEKPKATAFDPTVRIDVKHAIDPDAKLINTTPKDISVEELLTMKLPDDFKGTLESASKARIGDFEKQTYRIKGTLKSIVHRKDGDYFLSIAGKTGRVAVVEVPDPKLTKGSPIQDKIEETRKELEARYHPEDKAKDINEPVVLEGVGFYGTNSQTSASGSNRPPRLMPGTGFSPVR